MVENAFEIQASRFRVLLDTMKPRVKVVRDIVLTCVVLHNMLKKHLGEAGRTSTLADDLAALQNEQMVCVPDDNYRKPFEGGQTSARPTERLLPSSWYIDWTGEQDLRCVDQLTWGQKKLASDFCCCLGSDDSSGDRGWGWTDCYRWFC